MPSAAAVIGALRARRCMFFFFFFLQDSLPRQRTVNIPCERAFDTWFSTWLHPILCLSELSLFCLRVYRLYWGGGGYGEGVVCLTSPGRPIDFGLQLGKACYPCSRECFYFFYFFTFILSYLFFLPCPFLLSSLLFLLSLFSHSLGDDTKWPTGVDVSLNPNTINQSIDFMIFGIRFLYGDLRLIYKIVKFNENVYPLNLISMLKSITKTRLYNFDPLKPHVYTVQLGFTGVCIIYLISAQNIDCGYSVEPPRRGGSTEYPQSMFWAEIWKNIKSFYLKIILV